MNFFFKTKTISSFLKSHKQAVFLYHQSQHRWMFVWVFVSSAMCCIIFQDFSFEWVWKAKPKKFSCHSKAEFQTFYEKGEGENEKKKLFWFIFLTSSGFCQCRKKILFQFQISLSSRRWLLCKRVLLLSRVTLHDTADLWQRYTPVIFTQMHSPINNNETHVSVKFLFPKLLFLFVWQQ